MAPWNGTSLWIKFQDYCARRGVKIYPGTFSARQNNTKSNTGVYIIFLEEPNREGRKGRREIKFDRVIDLGKKKEGEKLTHNERAFMVKFDKFVDATKSLFEKDPEGSWTFEGGQGVPCEEMVAKESTLLDLVKDRPRGKQVGSYGERIADPNGPRTHKKVGIQSDYFAGIESSKGLPDPGGREVVCYAAKVVTWKEPSVKHFGCLCDVRCEDNEDACWRR